MKNILKSFTSPYRGNDKQASNDPPASRGKPESKKRIVTDGDRRTRAESIDDRNAHFVLGYN